jgi:rSAM/selenodomain-associated transferase 2
MIHSPTISVIIPAQNEQDSIVDLIAHIKATAHTEAVKEIIVAVNGTDSTATRASDAGAIVVTVGSSRAVALNGGHSQATGDILYFLHADSLPPPGWDSRIISAYFAGYHAGTFRLRFDSEHPLLRLSAWFTRFNWKFIRFGDQSLFVTQDVFTGAGKFDENMRIMEDREIINRIMKFSRFAILPQYLVTSERKYLRYGYWRLQAIYLVINVIYYLKLPQSDIIAVYRKLLGS